MSVENGTLVVLVGGNFAGEHGIVVDYDETAALYIIEVDLNGDPVPVGAARPEFTVLEDGELYEPEYDDDAEYVVAENDEDESVTLPAVPPFGMTRQQAGQYTADFIAGAVQITGLLNQDSGFLEFEAMDLDDMLLDLQVGFFEAAAALAAVSVRVERLRAAHGGEVL